MAHQTARTAAAAIAAALFATMNAAGDAAAQSRFAPIDDHEWTGAYGGFQLGYGDLDGDGGLGDDEGVLGGGHLGYQRDFGRWVLGGEVDGDFTDIDLGGGGRIDSIARIKGRVGRDLGRSLVYGTGGLAFADGGFGGRDVSETGWVIGGGYAWSLNERITLGTELLHHEFDDLDGPGRDASVTTLSARISFNF